MTMLLLPSARVDSRVKGCRGAGVQGVNAGDALAYRMAFVALVVVVVSEYLALVKCKFL